MNILAKARIVVDYIQQKWSAIRISLRKPERAWTSIGAILVDTIFQSGLNYRTVVFPRVRAVNDLSPDLNSLPIFEEMLANGAFDLALRWNHPEKRRRLVELICLLRTEGLENGQDLISWMGSTANHEKLLTLRGIGPKTVDYLGRLLGLKFIAVDRHALKLLKLAGVPAKGYREARRILEFAADLLLIDRWHFDQFVWFQLSRRQPVAGPST